MSDLKSKLQGRKPTTAIILGSALGQIVDIVQDPLVFPYTELSGFPIPKISGHAGKLVVGKIAGKEAIARTTRGLPKRGASSDKQGAGPWA